MQLFINIRCHSSAQSHDIDCLLQVAYRAEYQEVDPAIEEAAALSGQTLLEFGAPWCGHCQAAAPLIEAALSNRSDIQHIKVFDGRGKKLGRSFGVKLWPTLVLLSDGIEISRVVRPTSQKEIDHFLAHLC